MVPFTTARATPTALTLITAVVSLVTLPLVRLTLTVIGASPAELPVLLPAVAAAAVAGPLTWWLGPRAALPAALGTLAALWTLLIAEPLRIAPLIGLTLAVALATLVLLVRRLSAAAEDGAGRVARALALAVAADVTLRLFGDLWDPLWRGGALATVLALVLTGSLAAGAWATAQGTPPPARGGGIQVALLGPALGLYTVLGSPAFLAVWAGIPVTLAGVWITLGTAIGVAALSVPLPRGVPIALPLAVTFALLPSPVAAPAALLALAVLPYVVRRALTAWERTATTGHGALADLALAGAGCGVGCALVLVPGPWLVVAGAIGLGWAAGESVRPARLLRPFGPVVAASVLLAVPPLAGAARPAADPLPVDTAGGMYRLLNWEVTGTPPDEVLAGIEESGAQVAVLHGVPRGTPEAGGLDLPAWLEKRLSAETVWAADDGDRRTGTLVLTSLPVSERAEGPGYAALTVTLTDGEPSRIGAGSALGPLLREEAEVLALPPSAAPAVAEESGFHPAGRGRIFARELLEFGPVDAGPPAVTVYVP
ncbi:hypothetical protein [Streptomyces carpaticus]|uniref:hypothetical protein n=1 Tax=Streptomyces carpaticus TaxID=285558 RepID=UPI0031F99F5C